MNMIRATQLNSKNLFFNSKETKFGFREKARSQINKISMNVMFSLLSFHCWP